MPDKTDDIDDLDDEETDDIDDLLDEIRAIREEEHPLGQLECWELAEEGKPTVRSLVLEVSFDQVLPCDEVPGRFHIVLATYEADLEPAVREALGHLVAAHPFTPNQVVGVMPPVLMGETADDMRAQLADIGWQPVEGDLSQPLPRAERRRRARASQERNGHA